MKRIIALVLAIVSLLLFGCAKKNISSYSDQRTITSDEIEVTKIKSDEIAPPGSMLPDGTYEAEFVTDSSMFRVNDTKNGLGVLTVKDGKMTIHITLVSKKIVNLFVGKAKDAQKDGAEVLEPTVDKVTYEDGTTEEVFGFDVPVEQLGVEFDLAILGEKGKWYNHKVSVKNPANGD